MQKAFPSIAFAHKAHTSVQCHSCESWGGGGGGREEEGIKVKIKDSCHEHYLFFLLLQKHVKYEQNKQHHADVQTVQCLGNTIVVTWQSRPLKTYPFSTHMPLLPSVLTVHYDGASEKTLTQLPNTKGELFNQWMWSMVRMKQQEQKSTGCVYQERVRERERETERERGWQQTWKRTDDTGQESPVLVWQVGVDGDRQSRLK